MKRILLIDLLVLISLTSMMLGGCRRIDLSANTVTKEFNDITGFNRIEVSSAFYADISRSDTYSVSVVVNEKMADYLKVVKVGDTLEVGFRTTAWTSWLGIRSRPQVIITLPDLRGLGLSGASEGKLKGFKSSNDFELEVSGASNLDIDMETGAFTAEISGASHVNGNVIAGRSDLTITGASHTTLSGSGGDIMLDVSGASHAYLEKYGVVNANVIISGASQGRVNASGKLDVDLSGASHLEYGGKPTLGKINISGASSINPK
jgi:hypothetical protein